MPSVDLYGLVMLLVVAVGKLVVARWVVVVVFVSNLFGVEVVVVVLFVVVVVVAPAIVA